MSRLLGVCLVMLSLTAVSPTDAAVPVSQVEAAPGTIVRWADARTEECSMDGRSWQPLAGVCWFTIDLLRADGSVEVARKVAGVVEHARVLIGDYPYPVQHITLKDDSRVHLSAENLRRVASEQKKVKALWGTGGPARFELPLQSPLEKREGGSRFGSRRFFNDEPRSPHTGADYRAASGTPVFSVADGTVLLGEDLFFSGISAFIDHGDGLVSMYFHFSEILVESGDEVRRGQQIGRVGATGRATGPHLHFGVRWRGARINPELLLQEPAATTTIP